MKLTTLFIVVLALSLNSCRNTALNLTGGPSTLQGVYDDDYSLKIGRVSGAPDLYQFETCLTQAHLSTQGSSLSPEESCVPALQERGESITFYAVPAADKLTLSEEEQRSLLKMQREWGEYKNKQVALNQSILKQPKEQITLAVGAAVIGGSAASILPAYSDSQYAQRKAKKAQRKAEGIWNKKLSQPDWYADWYDEYIGTADKKSAVQEMVNTQEKLKNYRYSTTGPASSRLQNRGDIFSDEFIAHMDSDEIMEYLAKKRVLDDTPIILSNTHKYSDRGLGDVSFDYIVRKFLNKKLGRKITDIIDPIYLNTYVEYFQNSDFYKKYNDPKDSPDFFDTKRSKIEKIHKKYTYGNSDRSLFIEDLDLFVKNRGVPKDVLRDINKNKVILESLIESFPDSVLKNQSMSLGETLAAFQNSEEYINSARKLTKKSAKRIAIAIQQSLAVIIIGAVTTVAVLHHQRKPFREAKQEAKDALDKKELSFDNLDVLLQKSESSPLMSMDPYNNAQVSSVKNVLIYLSMAWDGINFENKATHYCFPSLQDKNTVTATCQPQGSS